MANEGNLKPISSVSEAREKGSRGGKARARNAKVRKAYAEHLRELLDLPMDSHKKPRDFCKSKSAGDVKNHGVTVEQATIQALVNRALKGELKAIELVLKLTGQMPDQNTEPPDVPFDEGIEEQLERLSGDEP